jgi:hypothetical protein
MLRNNYEELAKMGHFFGRKSLWLRDLFWIFSPLLYQLSYLPETGIAADGGGVACYAGPGHKSLANKRLRPEPSPGRRWQATPII